jgi:hypothetical protein
MTSPFSPELAAALENKWARYDNKRVMILPALTTLDPEKTWFLGTFSYVSPAKKTTGTRFLREDALIHSPDLQHPVTPTEVAREYLKLHHPEKRRARREQGDEIKAPRHAPMWAIPSIVHDASYVDIRAAYWSILNVVGWDTNYYPQKWLSRGRRPTDFPLPDDKVARNSLVSLCRATPARIWKSGKNEYRRIHNPHENHHLWAVVMDVLNAIAHYAVTECSAQYVNTDGYIVPSRFSDKLMTYIDEWGLQARAQERGRAVVKSIGAYKIGAKRTLLYDARTQVHELREVHSPADVPWLQSRFSKIAATK